MAIRPTDASGRLRVTWLDLAVAGCVAIVSTVALLVSDEPGARPADALAITLLLLLAAPLAVRSRWPTIVVATVSGVALVSFALGYPGGPPTIALLAALYSVAAAGHRWWTLAITVVFAGGGLLFRAVVESDPPVSIALDSALFVLVSLLGDTVHSRRALARESRERLRLAESERETMTQRRVAEERLRIAHELHDVMAHTVTTMSVQAAAALDSLDRRPDEARELLTAMRSASRQARQELRAAVSLLRGGSDGDGPDRRPAPALDQLEELLDGARRAALDVEHRVVGRPCVLPPAVELTAYRVVQEALTNVIRHADATVVRITLTYGDDDLVVQIDDDGCGPSGERAPGFGLRGLAERVDALAGMLDVGATPTGGFRVRARLPIEEDPT